MLEGIAASNKRISTTSKARKSQILRTPATLSWACMTVVTRNAPVGQDMKGRLQLFIEIGQFIILSVSQAFFVAEFSDSLF
jgi:hypothetical protein